MTDHDELRVVKASSKYTEGFAIQQGIKDSKRDASRCFVNSRERSGVGAVLGRKKLSHCLCTQHENVVINVESQ